MGKIFFDLFTLMFIEAAQVQQLVELRFLDCNVIDIFKKSNKKLISPNSVIITKYNNQKYQMILLIQ